MIGSTERDEAKRRLAHGETSGLTLARSGSTGMRNTESTTTPTNDHTRRQTTREEKTSARKPHFTIAGSGLSPRRSFARVGSRNTGGR